MNRIGKFILLFLPLMLVGCAGGMRTSFTTFEKDRVEITKSSPVEEAIHDLSKQLKQKGIEKLKICMGQYTYQDSNMSAAFSTFISSELSKVVIICPAFEEISRKELNQILEEQKLSLTGLIDPTEVTEVGKIKGVDAILTGNYWEQDTEVRVNLFLIKVVTAEKIAGTSFVLAENTLPQGLGLKPKNYDDCLSNIQTWNEEKGSAKDLKIKVWVDKGKSGIYKEEENVKVIFKANRNCYVRLYHVNAEMEIQMLFPNLYDKNDYIKANQVYSIPDAASAFEFKISPPFGAEIIKAVASLQPFPTEEIPSDNKMVFRSLGRATQNNIRGIMTRSISIIPVDARTEDMCIFTTVENKTK